MKKHLSFIILTLVLYAGTQLQAQIWLSNEDIYNEAEKYLNAEDYDEALPLFLLLERKNYKTGNVFYKIGTCYLNILGKKAKAISYLEFAAKNSSSFYTSSLYEDKAPLKAILMLGVSYRINNQPEKAIEIFEILKDSIKNTNDEMNVLVDLHIKRCENAIALRSFPGEAIKDTLPGAINSEYPNYNPVLTDKGSHLYYMERMKFYDAVMESVNSDGKWSPPKDITPSVHSDGDHLLVGSSSDGKKLLLYDYSPEMSGELYITEKTEKGWSKLKPLNNNINTKYHETHASLSADGKTIFFTSNRPDGFGGLDIYMSQLGKNNDWGSAVNLGPEINTPYNEESPFISSNDSILYFSSQGHLNIGGYDVFYSHRNGINSWSQPINMGSPVSTPDDDMFYYPMENGLHGLMSRLEENTNTSYDIYLYKHINFPNTPRYRVKGSILDTSIDNFNDFDVLVFDQKTGDTLQKVKPQKTGGYDLLLPNGDFVVIAKYSNDEFSKKSLSLNNEELEIIELVMERELVKEKLTEIKKEEKLAVDYIPQTEVKKHPCFSNIKSDTVFIKDILFEFNNSNILTHHFNEDICSVLYLLENDPSVTIKLIGYTDAVGSESYNLALSKKRAQAVANYLVANKIDKKRISVEGKGEADFAAINNNSDGTDNPGGRRYNRRVVVVPINIPEGMIIIKTIDIPKELIYK